MPNRDERIEALTGAIEGLLQKHSRLQLAAFILRQTDPQSLDRPSRAAAWQHARTELTAAVFQLSEAIVDDRD